MENPEYTLELLNDKNAFHVPRLFMEVFKKFITVQDVQNKYNTRYTGMDAVGIIAFDEQHKPIAFQGFIPCRFSYKGQTEIAIQSCDSLVVKEFRGKKVFADMQQFGMNLCYGAGATFVYGLGNQNSTPIIVKQGWTAKDEMKRFVISSGAIPFAKVILKLKMRQLYQRYVKFTLRKYIRTYNGEFLMNGDMNGVRIVYDKSYFNYKSYYFSHFIVIKNTPIWIKADNYLRIGQIMLSDATHLDDIINELKSISKKLGIRNILFQVKNGTPEEKALSAKFEGEKSWAVCFKNHNSAFPLESITLNFSDIDTF